MGSGYQSWWGKVSDWGRQLGDTFRTSIQGIKTETLKNQFTGTVNKVISTVSEKVVSELPNYFFEKWGLVDRGDSGERTENTPVQPHYVILNQNPTQSKAPATEPSLLGNLFGFLFPSQPKGTYNIGMPQSAPIPVNTVTTEKIQTGGGINAGWLIALAIGAVVLFMFLRRRK